MQYIARYRVHNIYVCVVFTFRYSPGVKLIDSRRRRRLGVPEEGFTIYI